jgi:hypothetical protein
VERLRGATSPSLSGLGGAAIYGSNVGQNRFEMVEDDGSAGARGAKSQIGRPGQKLAPTNRRSVLVPHLLLYRAWRKANQ